MKKNIKVLSVVILCFFNSLIYSQDHICYYMLNTEIKATVNENNRQKKMQENQAGNLAAETANKKQWFNYKAKMEKIQQRLNVTSLALQSLPSAYIITQEIKQISALQQKIIEELKDQPTDIRLVFKDQITFVKDAQMTIQLMAGIIISYGTINQMERAERKILLGFVENEFKRLRIHSWTTLSTLRVARNRRAFKANYLKDWISKDKKMIKEIITNANSF